jgi:PEP-CTERM motif
VVPNAYANVEGPSGNRSPFDTVSDRLNNMRYQQVYAASEFSALSSPIKITQIAFRPDFSFGHAFSENVSSVRIDMSTTSKSPDGLSSSFLANTGADDTVVFSAGPLTISSAFTGPSSGPKDFDIIITFATPFIYNPANGNLLLDIQNLNGGGPGIFFDATSKSITNDSVSREWMVFSNVPNQDSQGLITQFTFTPVPEPSTLLALGAVGLARMRKHHVHATT